MRESCPLYPGWHESEKARAGGFMTEELARMAFAGTLDADLIRHYNDVLAELNAAMLVGKKYPDIHSDAQFRHLVETNISQAIGAEVELVARGLAKKEDLTFQCGDKK